MTFTLRELPPLIQCTVVMVAVQCVADYLPPPENLSYRWIDPFHVHLSWQKPRDLPEVCETKYLVRNEVTEDKERKEDMFHESCITTEDMSPDGWIFNIQTVPKEATNSCGSLNPSEPLNISIGPQNKLVKDFICTLFSKGTMKCSWKPAVKFRDLEVFYGQCDNYTETQSACEHNCSGGDMCSCHLKVSCTTDDLCILLKGTLNGSPVRNTFKRRPILNVKIPPPKLNITEEERNLTLTWKSPDIGPPKHGWSYYIIYSKCNESPKEERRDEESMMVPYDKHCRYTFQIKSELQDRFGKGGSNFSEAETYGEDETPDWWLTVAVIVIPSILCVCVILSCYCFRRHRAIICPIVPDPSVIFKEMMMSRSKEPKTAPRNLYIPVPEVVESCKIALVADAKPPQENS